jgi:hypothetical protein
MIWEAGSSDNQRQTDHFYCNEKLGIRNEELGIIMRDEKLYET